MRKMDVDEAKKLLTLHLENQCDPTTCDPAFYRAFIHGAGSRQIDESLEIEMARCEQLEKEIERPKKPAKAKDDRINNS